MGSHARAEVFWGYDLGEMVDADYNSTAPSWWEERGGDWEVEVERRLGLPLVPYPEHLGRELSSLDRKHPDYVAWIEAARARQEARKALGVELGYYGYLLDGDAYHYVAVTASTMSTEYGCKPIGSMQVGADWPGKLQHFMDLLELPVPAAGPGWMIAASYG